MDANAQATPEHLNMLQQKARDWALLVVKLYHTDVPKDLEPEKRLLLKAAQKIKETIEKITGPISALSPMNEIQDQNLGFVFLIIGAAVILSAIAAITKWTLDYKSFMAKVADRNNLIAQGMSPQQAAQITATTAGNTGWLDSVKKFWPIGVIGLGALYYFSHKRG